MTPKQEAALRLALEALEVATTPLAKDRQEVLRARAAIREALAEQPAQPCGYPYCGCNSKARCKVERPAPVAEPHKQQEPVGHGGRPMTLRECMEAEEPASKPFVGLTEDEIDFLELKYAPPIHPDFETDADHCYVLIKKTEAKLKEKNA